MRLQSALFGLILGLSAGLIFGWQLGGYYTIHREFEQRYLADCDLAAPVLAADPAFRGLVPVNFPVAGFCLGGIVATRDEYDRLRKEMARLFGEPRVAHVMQDVWVKEQAALDGGH